METTQDMNPRDFVLWMNGALDLLDDTPPTQEQWNKLRAKLTEQVGAIVADRINTAYGSALEVEKRHHAYSGTLAGTLTGTAATIQGPTDSAIAQYFARVQAYQAKAAVTSEE